MNLGPPTTGVPYVITRRTASGCRRATSRAITPPRLQPTRETGRPAFVDQFQHATREPLDVTAWITGVGSEAPAPGVVAEGPEVARASARPTAPGPSSRGCPPPCGRRHEERRGGAAAPPRAGQRPGPLRARSAPQRRTAAQPVGPAGRRQDVDGRGSADRWRRGRSGRCAGGASWARPYVPRPHCAPPATCLRRHLPAPLLWAPPASHAEVTRGRMVETPCGTDGTASTKAREGPAVRRVVTLIMAACLLVSCSTDGEPDSRVRARTHGGDLSDALGRARPRGSVSGRARPPARRGTADGPGDGQRRHVRAAARSCRGDAADAGPQLHRRTPSRRSSSSSRSASWPSPPPRSADG